MADDEKMTDAQALQYLQEHGGLSGITKSDIDGIIAAGKLGNKGVLATDQSVPTTSASSGYATSPDQNKTDPPPTKAQITDAKAPTAPTPSPWEELSDQLVASYANTINEMNPKGGVAGATATADANMTSAAEADLGQSSTSPMAQYLNANNAAVAAQSSQTTAAEQDQVTAQDAGSAGIAKALQGLGTAEAEEMQSAPYQQLLQSLAAEVPYHLSEGYSIPGLADAPSWLQAAETAAGVNAGTGGATVPGSKTPKLPTPTTSVASPLQANLDQPTYSFAQGQ